MQFLLGRIDYERSTTAQSPLREFRLDRMHELLGRLGNPQQMYPTIHVAGTKGKGSCAAMTAATLTAAGYRTGLYTSPHLDRLEERIIIDGQYCSPEALVSLVHRVGPIVAALDAVPGIEPDRSSSDHLAPTWFEITTAMALLHFAAEQVDIAVVEVGLGGRLDSTNVVHPLVSIITSISFDHMKQLGSTLGAIAREKAGIIKPGVPVVSGVMNVEAQAAIEEVRFGKDAPIIQLGRDFDYRYQVPRDLDQSESAGTIDFLMPTSGGIVRYADLRLALVGRHQAANAAVSLAAIEQIRACGWQISESAIRRGLAEVHWPARVEIVRRRPAVVVDAAHNVASVASLLQTLDESFSTSAPRILIFATTQDKQVREMLELLLPRFDHVLLTRYTTNPRSVSIDELAALASSIFATPHELCDTPALAWRRACELATDDHLICATGSFFLAAELRGVVRGEGREARGE
ncbi:MAG TPA: folylpolyglutamate synthase/dihydrofolate synthase family protein [Pirellulales bacterium]|nr:folylpolyglutamate synthase/dihydrofolate synthase family protein [Pirellulales bacterium]